VDITYGFTLDINLFLSVCAIANTDWRTTPVSFQVSKRDFGQLELAIDAIHRL
jgi:hypothetical protein